MPITPLRGYVIPELSERPYFTKIVDMFNAMDGDIAASLQGAKYLYDAKGDILVASGVDTPARLPVGTFDGDALRVASAASTGVQWRRGGLYVKLGPSTIVSNTAAFTTLDKTIGIPAGALNEAGTVIRVRAGGDLASAPSAPGTLTVQLVNQANLVGASGVALLTNYAIGYHRWGLDCEIIVQSTGTSALLYADALRFGITDVADYGYQGVSYTADLTGVHYLQVAVQFSVAHTANQIRMTTFTARVEAPTEATF
jgi:hypothetical protein